MVSGDSEAAVHQLLLDHPELEFFYIIWLAYDSDKVRHGEYSRHRVKS